MLFRTQGPEVPEFEMTSQPPCRRLVFCVVFFILKLMLSYNFTFLAKQLPEHKHYRTANNSSSLSSSSSSSSSTGSFFFFEPAGLPGPSFPALFSPLTWYTEILSPYFFSLVAFCSWGWFSLADYSGYISIFFQSLHWTNLWCGRSLWPSSNRPEYSVFIFGWCLEQNGKRTDSSLGKTLRIFSFFSYHLWEEHNSSPHHNSWLYHQDSPFPLQNWSCISQSISLRTRIRVFLVLFQANLQESA